VRPAEPGDTEESSRYWVHTKRPAVWWWNPVIPRLVRISCWCRWWTT